MHGNNMEDDRRNEIRIRIRRKIERKKSRERITSEIKKAVPGICVGAFLVTTLAWDLNAPLPDTRHYKAPKFQADNGLWYTQADFDQMCIERDAYHLKEQEEAESEAELVRNYQERSMAAPPMIISDHDAYLMEKVAMAEAESEDTEGKALVMLVILNRVKSDRFPDSIEGVIFEDTAFSSIDNGRYDMVEPDDDCREALKLITDGHWDGSCGATYYDLTEGQWHQSHFKKLFTHGAHTFYIEKE